MVPPQPISRSSGCGAVKMMSRVLEDIRNYQTLGPNNSVRREFSQSVIAPERRSPTWALNRYHLTLIAGVVRWDYDDLRNGRFAAPVATSEPVVDPTKSGESVADAPFPVLVSTPAPYPTALQAFLLTLLLLGI